MNLVSSPYAIVQNRYPGLLLRPYAGQDHGWHFPLLGGNRVLLTFLNGDPNRPPSGRQALQTFQESMRQIQAQHQAEVEANWQRLEADLRQEMHQHLNATGVPEYHLLSPMAIKRIINEDDLNAYIERLWAYYDGEHRESPREALGYRGLEIVKDEDAFIGDNLGDQEGKLFAQVDQSRLLFQHSGMRIPSEDLFDEVYVKEIWKRLREESRFGLYE